ncbi:hypothetical protein BUALT_Bualt05G0123400 [Buddleja alternifolia]|uniref:Retrotransposon gag domain-containing protein n=1 Tax=Buddleja alternifolia TaxID=168488 RepID=A0AAV6XS17_9LAMI|nr:hypothetical protein BUALT_Bualt05G0123400 [Buddleja alternifolia]
MIENGCINCYQSHRSSDLTARITMAEEVEIEMLRQDVDEFKDRFRKTSEKWNQSLEELRKMIGKVSLNDGKRKDNSGFRFEFLPSLDQESPTKCLTNEFPDFCGENAIEWLYQCEHTFEINRTPAESRVEMAVMHMEGKALQWYKILIRARLTRDPLRWTEFVDAVRFRFVNDPITELTKLKQIGSVLVYLNQFDGIENCWNISKYDAINLFLTGLREDIKSVVQKFKLKTLHEASCLAKLQEQALILASKQSSLPSSLNSTVVEKMECKPRETNPSSNDSKFTFISCQPLNAIEPQLSIRSLSTDVANGELNVLGEYSKLQASEVLSNHDELKLFDEMLDKEFLKKGAQNYIIDGCPNILLAEPQELKEELNDMCRCGKLKNSDIVIKIASV